MATDRDPYFAFPKLYGAPAYARPPRVVDEGERPFDPDELPLTAEQTEEERRYTVAPTGSSSPPASNALQPSAIRALHAPGDGAPASGRGFRLRVLTGRLGPRNR